MSTWKYWKPMATAPKDGRTIVIRLPPMEVSAYWDDDLKRWVTCWEHKLNYVDNGTEWRAGNEYQEGQTEAEAVT